MLEHDARTVELSGRLVHVRERIAGACRAAGRDPGEVTLIAVTKTYPADDVLRLAGLGVTDVGENRDQEAAPKAAAVAAVQGTAAQVRVRWHFVGRLQRNKCRSVVRYANVVHSVDSVRLADALAEAARRRRSGSPLAVLIQVSVDDDETRGGAGTAEIGRIAETVAEASDALTLRGVMAVAPLGWEPGAAFEKLARVAARLRETHPEATWISAGMSGDLESAIEHGSTHLRVGSALLGNRPRLG